MNDTDDVKTSGLKLSETRPCDVCGGPIAPQFYILESKFALFGKGTNSVLGMIKMMSWGLTPKALAIAEAMAPDADRAVVVSEDDRLNTEVFICQKCYLGSSIPIWIEKIHDRKETSSCMSVRLRHLMVRTRSSTN
jgi:hypothetical protein